MDLQLTDKVAIVTGSSRGLGRASALALAAEGCRVTLCARGAESRVAGTMTTADIIRDVTDAASGAVTVALRATP